MTENARGRRRSTFQAWSLRDLISHWLFGLQNRRNLASYACRSSESSPASGSHGDPEPLRHLRRVAVAALASARESKNHWPLSVRRAILRNEYLVFVMNGLDGSGAVNEPGLMLFHLAGVGTSKHRNETTINTLTKTASVPPTLDSSM
jgi:hypothetical protein